MGYFFSGIVALSLMMGFMVGASNSPVVGVTLTAGIGIVASLIAVWVPKAPVTLPTDGARGAPITSENLRSLGQVLLAFSLTFTLGMAGGIWAKSRSAGPEPQTSFPWHGVAAPASARVALDWLIVQKNLRAMGYSDAQIQVIYSLSLEPKRSGSSLLESEAPLSSLFGPPKSDANTPTRLLAIQPPVDSSLMFKPFPEAPSVDTKPKISSAGRDRSVWRSNVV